MPENNSSANKKSFSPDWLVRGVLTKVGETFDRLTGRNWKPSSSIATSELIERLKKLLDDEAKDSGNNKKFVPHNIKLKMQWDKFSTDAESSMAKLEHELLIAAVDHINDCRYHTYAPMKLEIKPDYFTEGVKLLASFGNFSESEGEADINVSVPDLKNVVINAVPEIVIEPEKEIYTVEFTAQGKAKRIELAFAERQRLSVGRTKENDLQIDDPSVSKIHAALVLNSDKQLMVADTGSTNGTFINDGRIAYGKAILINDTDKLRIGTVNVRLTRVVKEPVEEAIEDSTSDAETIATAGKTFIKLNPIADRNATANDFPTIAATEKINDAPTQAMTNDEIAAASEPRIKLDFNENQK